jgi:hypothetical protein
MLAHGILKEIYFQELTIMPATRPLSPFGPTQKFRVFSVSVVTLFFTLRDAQLSPYQARAPRTRDHGSTTRASGKKNFRVNTVNRLPQLSKSYC